MDSFNCDCCGICCEHIKEIAELKEYALDDGSCKFLDKLSKKCKIYENRPLICRVEAMYKLKFSSLYSRDEFYKLNQKACEQLKQIYKKD